MKTNISPENWWLDDETSFQNGPFSGDIPSFSGRIIVSEESFIILLEEILHQLIWTFLPNQFSQGFLIHPKGGLRADFWPIKQLWFEKCFFVGTGRILIQISYAAIEFNGPPMDLPSFFNKNLPLKPSNMQRVLVGKQCNEPRCCINHRCNTRFFQLVVQVWQMIQQELTKKEQSDMQNHETSAWETGGKIATWQSVIHFVRSY